MTKKDVDHFFKELSKTVKTRLKIYLTGGAAALFLGGNRPTRDIDFEFQSSSPGIAARFEEVSQRQKIAVQYSDTIQHWGMIAIPQLTKGSRLHKHFGSVSVFILAPEKWAIGKLSRYFESDVEDLVAVLTRQKPPLKKTLNLWKQALRTSPVSTDQFLFKNQVNHFLKTYGKKIWGRICPEKLF